MDLIDNHAHPDWLVGNPSGIGQFSALWMGSVGLLILGLQPILLGALFNEGRVTFDELALAATFEIFAIGIGSVIAAFLVSSKRLPEKTIILLLALFFCNVFTVYSTSASTLTIWRGVAGFQEGGLVAISVELIARSRFPERFGGYFVSLQTGLQCVLALFLSQWIIPTYGSTGGFLALAFVCLISLPFLRGLPQSYGKVENMVVPGSPAAHFLLPLLALLSIFCFYLFLGSLWAFVEPLGGQFGISASTIGLMVSLSLLSQLVGALIATWAERRINFRVALIASTIVAVVIASALTSGPGLILFWICILLTGFIWLFIVPYQIAIAVVADENRQAALLVPAAQLFGAALGPIGASLFLDGSDFRPVSMFAGGSAIASLLFVIGFIVVSETVSKA